MAGTMSYDNHFRGFAHTEEDAIAEERVYWNGIATRAATDKAAFAALYRHFFPIVYKYVLRRMPAGDVDEVTGRVFLRVYEHIGDYDREKAAFSTWLFRIASNEIARIFGASSSKEISSEWEDVPIPAAPVEESPEQRFLRQEENRRLHVALQALPERDQRIIAMTYWLDMSSEEIGAALGEKPNTIRVALKRARETLKKRLEEE